MPNNDNPSGSSVTGLEIAVIGMAGRFPNSKSIAEFWDNLKCGVNCISHFTDRELEEAGMEPGLSQDPNYVKARGILEDIEYFDSSFFDYIPMEAELMDPQMRIFHECTWEALEDAGYVPGRHKGRIGLFAGATAHLRWEVLAMLSEKSRLLGTFASWQLFDKDFMSTRISYKLNLLGPSINVQTACSTSLVAIHLACQGLLSGECYMALAGGITASIPNKKGYRYRDGMIGSPDGCCRTFDAEAKGTVSGEGVGIVLLKSLEGAVNDGDSIYAVIKSSAINNDGKGKVGYTAPSVKGQVGVIRSAHRAARVSPESISYVEAHGTGTKLGDPTELEALSQAFNTNKKGFCRIGSVKSNLGHVDSAAGAAGFIKTVLALKHRQIPPSLHFENPNPRIDFADSPFVVNTELHEWKSNGYPLRAGVSSFGIGGTNAHVILEEYKPEMRISKSEINPKIRSTSRIPNGPSGKVFGPTFFQKGGPPEAKGSQLILLSARSEAVLGKMTKNLAAHFRENPGISLTDAAYTLQAGRAAFPYRKAAMCATVTEVMETLSSAGPGKTRSAVVKRKEKPVIFMFPGQGAQYVTMGLGLYRSKKLFREEMDRCFEILKPLMGYDLKEILYPETGRRDLIHQVPSTAATQNLASQPEDDIDRTAVAQPLLFIIEYALAKMLINWGIKPYAMIGHSIGEYTAACLSGIFSLEDTLRLVVIRGKSMQQTAAGAMLSVSLSAEELSFLLKSNDEISLAAINSPTLCVVSGPAEAIAGFSKKLNDEGHTNRLLHTSHAFHSKLMDPVLDEFQEAFSTISLNKPRIPYISNLTGKWITVKDAADPGYWTAHLRRSVQFSAGVNELLKTEDSVFLEVGPGKALATFVRQQPGKKDGHGIIELVRHPKKEVQDDDFLVEKIGELWLSGVEIDWTGIYAGENRRRISLPTYPFERRHYPVVDDPFKKVVQMLSKNSQLKKRAEIADWFYVPLWEKTVPASPKPAVLLDRFTWLVFTGECSLDSRLVEELQRAGHQVIAVRAGQRFHRVNDREFTLNPGQDNDYDSLFAELRKSDRIPRKILHLWGVTGDNGKVGPGGLGLTLDKGFYSLLNIARAAGKQLITAEMQIDVLTNNMQEVTGTEDLCPEKAAVLGAVHVISGEYPNIRCRSIDIESPRPGSGSEQKLLNHLAGELAGGSPGRVIAYRGKHRWLQVMKPVPFDKPAEAAPGLREKGVYLITGGLGGIGLTLAEYLAVSVGARLVLTSRSPFPARSRWEEWLTADEDRGPTGVKIRELLKLEKQGAEVLVLCADAADPGQMRDVLARTRERFGPVNGIIHAAGLPDGGVIYRRTREMSERIFAAKIKGTIVLDSICEGERPDFVVLCSSLSSILPPPGQVAYSAANAFQDAFALYKTSIDSEDGASPLYISINWDAWQEVGMAVEAMKKFSGAGDMSKVGRAAVAHPLFDYCLPGDANKKIYVGTLDAKSHWVLDEHRILGKPTLPGTACLELVRAAFEDHTGCEQMEIREVLFPAPLRLEEKEKKEVHTLLHKQGNSYRFTIAGKSGPAEDKWVVHARGEVAGTGPEPGKRHDIKELVARCSENEIHVTEEMLNAERKGDKLNFVFGPRWKNVKRINQGPGRVLLYLELGEPFDDDMKFYKLHPALVDTGVGFYLRHGASGQASLPFSYKRIGVKKPLTRRIYSYQEYDEHSLEGEKIISYNITILDEQGLELVVFEEYKRLSVSEDAMGRLSRDTLGSGSYAPANEERAAGTGEREEQGILKHGLLPAEGVEVFQRILARKLPRVVISTRDLLSLTKLHEAAGEPFLKEEPAPVEIRRGPVNPRPEMREAYITPAGETEKELALIWESFLGIESVGGRDDFFELGGDSLKAITITTRIHKNLGVEVPVGEFFNNPTIAGIAKYINETKKSTFSRIKRVEEKEFYPLSSAQMRLYLINRLAPHSTVYNLPEVLVVDANKFDRKKAEEVFKELVKRHESLRTMFETAAGEPVQKIHKNVEFKIEYYEAGMKEPGVGISEKKETGVEIPSPGGVAAGRGGSGEQESRAEIPSFIIHKLVADFVRPFDLSQAPLMRVGLLKQDEEKFLLMIDIHHIISDALSLTILFNEFLLLYEGLELPALSTNYKDYSAWQAGKEEQEKLIKQEQYWLKQFEGDIPVLNLPMDYPRSAVMDFAGKEHKFRLSEEENLALRKLAFDEGVTLYMLFLAIFNVLLWKLSGQEDIIVGTTTAGRSHTDLQNIVGMFVNTLALGNNLHDDKTFRTFLREVSESTLKAFENQDYQFENLIEKMELKRDSGRNPLFDVGFELKNLEVEARDWTPQGAAELNFARYDYKKDTSIFDLFMSVSEFGENLEFSVEYSTNLFEDARIERLIDYYKEIVKIVIVGKEIKLKDIVIFHELDEAVTDMPEIGFEF